MTSFVESEVWEAVIARFADPGYTVLSGPAIAPGEAGGAHRLPSALPPPAGPQHSPPDQPHLPESAADEAARKLTTPSSASLIEKNHTFHRYLTDGIPVEYRENRTIRHGLAKVIDLEEPGKNDFGPRLTKDASRLPAGNLP